MKINSPVASFVEVLKQVRDVSVRYQAKLRASEAATRASLVDPVLRALGWDTGSPDMVELEKTWGNTRLDYGLLDCRGEVCIIVEAKPLGANLTDPRVTTQLFSYGFNYRIQNIVLTDGVVWQHYFQVSPGNIDPDSIDISNDDLAKCADFFISIFDAYRYWPAPAPEAVSQLDVLPVSTPPSQTPMNPEAEADSDYTALSDLPADLPRMTSLHLLRLPDGRVTKVRYWRDILVECAKFVLAQVQDIPIPLPDHAGKKISLLSEMKPAKRNFEKILYHGKTIYLNTHYSAKYCVENALYILSFLPKVKTWQTVSVNSVRSNEAFHSDEVA